MLMYETNAIFLKSKAPKNAGGKVLSNVLALPIVRINWTNIVTSSQFPVLASAQRRGVLPNKLSYFGNTEKSIFPMISVVSKFLNHSAPTLFFSSSSRMFLYFILVVLADLYVFLMLYKSSFFKLILKYEKFHFRETFVVVFLL